MGQRCILNGSIDLPWKYMPTSIHFQFRNYMEYTKISYDILWSLGPNTSPTHLQTNGGWKPMVFPRILVNSPRISKPLPPVALLGSSWWFRWGKWLSSLSENEVYNPSGHVNMENIGKWWFTSEFRGSLGSRESHILMNQMFVGNISY
jgi:hypothetical protein